MAGSPDRWPIYRAAFREAGRAAAEKLRALGTIWRPTPRPDRLVLAPQDLRTRDPITAEDLAAGLFVFAGRTVQTGATSPFAVIAPSPGWAEGLYGFAWLRHLSAEGAGLQAERGRALAGDAIGPRRRELGRGPARKTEVVARRVISLLAASPLLLAGADHAFYRRYLRAIGAGAGQLRRDMTGSPRPKARLQAAVALAYAGLSCEGLERELARASRVLSRELDAQVLADGGPLSRNPADLVDLLLDLLPLRLLFESRSVEAPTALGRALDRMVPMLRFFRHGDGEMALFNGMGRTPLDALATIFAHDQARGAPPKAATPSGYQRLEAGRSILIVDSGPPPPVPASAAAHAGCLSFELSAGGRRIVVNCGAPPVEGPLREAARRTVAHSTLAIGDVSSASFFRSSGEGLATGAARYLYRELGPVLLEGPRGVEVARRVEEDGHQRLSTRHDGYGPAFGVLHERRLRLSPDGLALEGFDALRPQPGRRPRRRGPAPAVALRFHLAPGTEASLEPDGVAVDLPGGERWRFSCDEAGTATVEGSVSFAVPEGRRAARQIVVALPWPEDDREAGLAWRLERISPAEEPPG